MLLKLLHVGKEAYTNEQTVPMNATGDRFFKELLPVSYKQYFGLQNNHSVSPPKLFQTLAPRFVADPAALPIPTSRVADVASTFLFSVEVETGTTYNLVRTLSRISAHF